MSTLCKWLKYVIHIVRTFPRSVFWARSENAITSADWMGRVKPQPQQQGIINVPNLVTSIMESNYQIASNTSLTNVGLAITLSPGSWILQGKLTTSVGAGGGNLALASTGTYTYTVVDIVILSNQPNQSSQNVTEISAGTFPCNITYSPASGSLQGTVLIQGVLTTTSASTINVQFAQNTSNLSASAIGQGYLLAIPVQ